MISGSETWLMKVRRELMLDRIEMNMIRFVQFASKERINAELIELLGL